VSHIETEYEKVKTALLAQRQQLKSMKERSWSSALRLLSTVVSSSTQTITYLVNTQNNWFGNG
jgi:hypothetical protein